MPKIEWRTCEGCGERWPAPVDHPGDMEDLCPKCEPREPSAGVIDELQEENAKLRATLAAVRNQCDENVGSTCDNDWEIGNVTAYEEILKLVDRDLLVEVEYVRAEPVTISKTDGGWTFLVLVEEEDWDRVGFASGPVIVVRRGDR